MRSCSCSPPISNISRLLTRRPYRAVTCGPSAWSSTWCCVDTLRSTPSTTVAPSRRTCARRSWLEALISLKTSGARSQRWPRTLCASESFNLPHPPESSTCNYLRYDSVITVHRGRLSIIFFIFIFLGRQSRQIDIIKCKPSLSRYWSVQCCSI